MSVLSDIPVSLKRCFIPCDIRIENLETMLNICIKYKQNKETLYLYEICDHVRGIFEEIFLDTEMGTEKILSRNKG